MSVRRFSRQARIAFLDICELQVDRSGAGTTFTPLAFDTNRACLAVARGRRRVGDQRVGQWSKSVSVTVGG